jgi:hypothetical protein
MHRIRVFLSVVAIVSFSLVAFAAPKHSYLYLWSGDADHNASDFLGMIDADPHSKTYGHIVASIPVGAVGTHPHHTEDSIGPNDHLLADGFHAGRTWLFDLNDPLKPRILTTFSEVGGFNHPHSYLRLPDGNVLATFQYKGEHSTGGLVEMTERGKLMKSASAADDAVTGSDKIFPYAVLPIPKLNVAVSTSTDMDPNNTAATAQWIQLWRLSDLKLKKTIALEPGPGGKENQLTGEPRLLPDGKSVYIHTFQCGLYLLRGADTDSPTVKFVRNFKGQYCGVPILTGHYWLQPIPDEHGMLSLDITDPEHPKELSRVTLPEDEAPHWAAIDPSGTRIVMNSSGYVKGHRLWLVNFDRVTGKLTVDENFRDPDDHQPGIDLNGKSWPHGFKGNAVPHGTVFSR